MRTRTVAALVLLLALAPAACARNKADDPSVASAQKGGVKPSSSPSATASEDPDAPLKFSRCMREQGISWFPDPKEGKMSIAIPQGTDRKKLEAAQEACKKFLPNGGQMHQPSAEELEQARQMAKCMRENGVPNFPDPNPDGGLNANPDKLGFSPNDPSWKKAEAACAQYGPKGGEVHRNGSGGTVGGGKAA
jgi:hypothetical protein